MILSETIRKTFSAAEVSDMTGARPDSIQNWIKRKLIVGHRDIQGGGSQGRHRQFTFENVMEIAIARAIIQMNCGAKEAFAASSQFAHVGGGGATFSLPNRFPGLPFHHSHGDTLFGIAGNRTFETAWSSGGTRDTYKDFRYFLQSDHFITVNVSTVFQAVCAHFKYHPSKILDAAYPEDAT